jgi:hypothetical protein
MQRPKEEMNTSKIPCSRALRRILELKASLVDQLELRQLEEESRPDSCSSKYSVFEIELKAKKG